MTTAGPARARAFAEDGRAAVLDDERPLVVGRDPGCGLSFPDEPRLSRRAAHLAWNGFGVLVTNLSRTHALVVTRDDTAVRLPSLPDRPGAEPTTGWFLGRGRATISGPSWPGSPFVVTLDVAVHEFAVVGDLSGGVALTAGTREPLRLNPRTKEFVVALLLCRHRLEQGPAAAPPAVPQLTREVLAATNSWHLVRELDTDDVARRRLTGRVHEHLKGLRAKVAHHGLVPEGTRITPGVLVEVLIGVEAVVAGQLALLADEGWLRTQERLWWAA